VFAHVIAPDKSPHANEQINEIAFKPPGFSITVLRQPLYYATADESFLSMLWKGRKNTYKEIPINTYYFNHDSIYAERYIGDGISGQQIAIATKDLLGESLTVDKVIERIEQEHIYTKKFLFGTDDLGRDYFSRILLGTRVSLLVGIIAVLIALLIGIPAGIFAGYYNKRNPAIRLYKNKHINLPVDSLVMWFINVIWAIPALLLVFPIVLAFGQNFYTIFIAVGCTIWVDIARMVRGQTLQVRELEYIQATKTFAYADFRVMFRHILPNITSPIIVITAANFAYAILLEAGLSFLGIGVQPPAPSWGLLISKYKDNLITDTYLALIPGIAITILVFAFFTIGNGLRDALDVKTKIEH
jgi:peptide/nickel transport system permease protein